MVIKIHNPFDNHPEGLFARITKEMVMAHDWLAGTPMTERERASREIGESARWQLPLL